MASLSSKADRVSLSNQSRSSRAGQYHQGIMSHLLILMIQSRFNQPQPATAGFSSFTQSVTISRLFQYIHSKAGVYPMGRRKGVHMPNRMNMSTVEERLTKVETNLANLADAQRDVSQALNKVSESIHAIQISIERQNASIHQIVELRRDVDEMSKDVDKLKGKVWWLGGVSAACTFIIVNFSRLKDFFH